MVRLIPTPTRIQAEGQPPKIIEESFGRLNSGTSTVGIARMVSPSGWSEPGQTPSFDEFTVWRVFRDASCFLLTPPVWLSSAAASRQAGAQRLTSRSG